MSKGFYSFFLSLSLLSTHRKTRIMKQKYGEHITKVKKNNCIKTTRELYLPRIIQNNLKHNTMEFPIYTKHPENRYFACLKDRHESVLVVGGIWPRIDATRYRNITSNEYDEYANRVTVQCTREEFMEAYNKAIETINSKL